MVVFGQQWLYSDRNSCIGANWLCSAKVVVYGQKWFYWGKSGCIRAKWL